MDINVRLEQLEKRIGWLEDRGEPGKLSGEIATVLLALRGGANELELEGKRWLSTYDACLYLNVSRYVLKRLVEIGELKRYKYGGQYRYDMADIDAFKKRAEIRVDSTGKESEA